MNPLTRSLPLHVRQLFLQPPDWLLLIISFPSPALIFSRAIPLLFSVLSLSFPPSISRSLFRSLSLVRSIFILADLPLSCLNNPRLKKKKNSLHLYFFPPSITLALFILRLFVIFTSRNVISFWSFPSVSVSFVEFLLSRFPTYGLSLQRFVLTSYFLVLFDCYFPFPESPLAIFSCNPYHQQVAILFPF